uniref:Uncharacterized protein n=1 Tax=Tetranychus urticae TaxID=32264 RepID=T1L5D6_TETUR
MSNWEWEKWPYFDHLTSPTYLPSTKDQGKPKVPSFGLSQGDLLNAIVKAVRPFTLPKRLNWRQHLIWQIPLRKSEAESIMQGTNGKDTGKKTTVTKDKDKANNPSSSQNSKNDKNKPPASNNQEQLITMADTNVVNNIPAIITRNSTIGHLKGLVMGTSYSSQPNNSAANSKANHNSAEGMTLRPNLRQPTPRVQTNKKNTGTTAVVSKTGTTNPKNLNADKPNSMEKPQGEGEEEEDVFLSGQSDPDGEDEDEEDDEEEEEEDEEEGEEDADVDETGAELSDNDSPVRREKPVHTVAEPWNDVLETFMRSVSKLLLKNQRHCGALINAMRPLGENTPTNVESQVPAPGRHARDDENFC